MIVPPRLVPKRRSEHMGGNGRLGAVVVDHISTKRRQLLSHKIEQCMEAKEGIGIMLIRSLFGCFVRGRMFGEKIGTHSLRYIKMLRTTNCGNVP